MTKPRVLNPHGLTTVRDELSRIVGKLHADGLHAHPLVFGRYNRPEAVLISVEQYLILIEHFDDLLDESKLSERVASAPPDDELELETVEDLAAELGINMKN
ncbi:hypothetical protein ACQEU5_24870 [Marinactinospora thermotolerans]|uniref:hypothetical protein n=1 Tax=Marinactinospora thermotolerans TaxID=531310 RepID=UPI003D93F3BC